MTKYLRRNNHTALRFIESTDASLLMELNNDPEIARYVVGTPRQVTLEEQARWMDNLRFETRTKRFIVEHDGASVGTVIVSDIDEPNKTANLNIKLKHTVWGKGIGKQSILLAMQYCFEELGLFCVTAHILSYNTASIALFNSCGFVAEGVMRSRVVKEKQRFDLISFSALRSEYEEKNASHQL